MPACAIGSHLPASLDALPLDLTRLVAVVCGSGHRSNIAASLLRQRGFAHVVNTMGGMTAWTEAGLPLTTDDTASSAQTQAHARAA